MLKAQPPASSELETYAFGLFELHVATGELRRGGRPVHLAPQPARLLAALVTRAGQVVTRDELKRAVWDDDTTVDFEQGLNFCIKEIRAALGDAAENPQFIETVPRRGYRFIAPVERRTATPRSRRALPLAAAAIGVTAAAVAALMISLPDRPAGVAAAKSLIAVVPFENLSGDPSQDFFSEGFTGELIAQLGRISPTRLGVISRTSMYAYRDTLKSAAAIGHELGVQHIVEGTVRRSGDRVRIDAQLIRVSDQSQVWAEIYEGEVRDILTIQQDVGQAIARQIEATLTAEVAAKPRTVDPAVYDLYLNGRMSWNRRRPEEVGKAAAAFTEAVRLDPTFAPAFAGLADSLLVLSRPAALAAADKALALDDRLAEAHTARATTLTHMLRWDEAEAAFRRAIALDPSYVPARYFYADHLTARGQCAQAIEQARAGLALDPLSVIATHAVGVTLYYCRDTDAALPYLKKALELDPQHYWSHFRIGLVLEQRQSYDAALAAFDRTPARIRSAYTLAAAGRMSEARRLVREALADPQRDTHAYHIAGAYVGLGEHDEALAWLAKALRSQAFDVIFLDVDPRLDPLRRRPAFQQLRREGGWH